MSTHTRLKEVRNPDFITPKQIADCKKDYDAAVAAVGSTEQPALLQFLRGRMGNSPVDFPGSPNLSIFDANFVLDIAQRQGWPVTDGMGRPIASGYKPQGRPARWMANRGYATPKKEGKMLPTLRQLFLTETAFGMPFEDAPGAPEEEDVPPFEDLYEPREDAGEEVALDVMPAEFPEEMGCAGEEEIPDVGFDGFAGVGEEIPIAAVGAFGGFEDDDNIADEEVEEFAAEHPGARTARTAPSGRAFEGFDRFMDKILIQESTSVQRPDLNQADSLQRVRAAKHQERPLGRIRYVRQ